MQGRRERLRFNVGIHRAIKRMLVLFLLSLFAHANGRICHCRAKTPSEKPSEYTRLPVVGKNPTVSIGKGKGLDILNSCSFEVQLGVTGSEKGPSKNGVCAVNQVDNGEGRCFWFFESLPTKLSSKQRWKVELDSEDEHLFSGNVWGVKTGQLGLACPSGRCSPWVGPRGAVTKAEFTFSKTGIDYWDVSIIEGANIPVAMYPSDAKVDTNDRYKCGVAGGCTWDFNPEPELKKFVTQVIPSSPEVHCGGDVDCPPGQRCGSTFDDSPPTYGVCGTFNGYASAHTSCMSGSTGPPFFCEKNSDVISCMGDYNLSGYNQAHGTKVCGCPDWESMGIDAPAHVACQTTDKNWEENSLPFLRFLKEGCPLAYEFAYSDMTSTVTCGMASTYIIEFCPRDSEQSFFD